MLILIDLEKSYKNGEMSNILINKLKKNKLNKSSKKDYYFLVLNKTDASDIIINSVKGLNYLTANSNNLPFQIKWSNNKLFTYENIKIKTRLLVKCFQKPIPSWQENFMLNIRTI